MFASLFDSISYFFVNFFYYVEIFFLKTLNIFFKIFDILAGNKVIVFNLPENLISNVLIGKTVIGIAIWVIAIIGLFLLLNLIFKKKKAVKNAISLLLCIVLFTAILVSSINVNNAIISKASILFNNELETSETVYFTDDDYATMYRILVKVGNYSLSGNSEDVYNINSCFNEIRPDLQILEKNGFFKFDYNIDGINSNWQAEISKIGRSQDLSQDLKLNSENKELTAAISSCMKQIKENGAFRPLKSYRHDFANEDYNSSVFSNLQSRFNASHDNPFELYDLIITFGLLFIIVELIFALINFVLKLTNIMGLLIISPSIALSSSKNERKKSIYITRISIAFLSVLVLIFITKLFTLGVDFILGKSFENILVSTFGVIRNSSSILHRTLKIAGIFILAFAFNRITVVITDAMIKNKMTNSIKSELFKNCTIIDMYFIIVSLLALFVIICSTIKYKLVIIIIHFVISSFLLLRMHGNHNYMNLIYIAKYILNPKEFDRTNKDSELYGNKKNGYFKTALRDILSEQNEDRFKSSELYDIISFTDIKDTVVSFNDEYYASIIEFKYGENTLKYINKIIDSLHENQFINVIRLRKAYYLAIFDRTIKDLGLLSYNAINELQDADSRPEIVSGKRLAVFFRDINLGEEKYDSIDRVDEEDFTIWSMPHKLIFGVDAFKVDGKIVSVKRVKTYPDRIKDFSENWLTDLLALNGEKVLVKIWPKTKASSKYLNLFNDNIKKFNKNHYLIDTFVTLSNDNVDDEKYGFSFDYLYYCQLDGFISSQISKYDKSLTIL